MNQSSALPTRKVGSGALAGAVTVIVLWIINTATGVEVPPEVASAITFLLMFAASYFVPEGSLLPGQETPVAPAETEVVTRDAPIPETPIPPAGPEVLTSEPPSDPTVKPQSTQSRQAKPKSN